jgi:hypothetical protein
MVSGAEGVHWQAVSVQWDLARVGIPDGSKGMPHLQLFWRAVRLGPGRRRTLRHWQQQTRWSMQRCERPPMPPAA